MKLFGSEGILLMEVEKITVEDRQICISGKMMGQIPMKVVLRASDLRESLKLLSGAVIWQAVKMLFSRSNSG